jgi:hypothetical protein
METIEPYRVIESWDQLVKVEAALSEEQQEWVFRGEGKHRQPQTTLQRVCDQFDIRGAQSLKLESWLVQEFRRHFPVYSGSVLSDHFKSGQRLSVQNRPTEVSVRD